MFPRYRHTPILDSQRKRCPVCNQSVYSPAGIHPQCAERQADPPRPKTKPQDLPIPPDSPTRVEAPTIDQRANKDVKDRLMRRPVLEGR